MKKYDELILEEYIGGQEIQVAVINNNPLGAIELIPKDYFTIIKLSIPRKQKQTCYARKDNQKKYNEVSKNSKKNT